MSNVIEIGAARVTKQQSTSTYGADICHHTKISLDAEGGIVTCKDCLKQLEPFWALMMVTRQYSEHFESIKARAEAVVESEKRGLHLKAAQAMESNWRGRKMAPACPHCNEALFPEDCLRLPLVNWEMASRRRNVTRQQALVLTEIDGDQHPRAKEGLSA